MDVRGIQYAVHRNCYKSKESLKSVGVTPTRTLHSPCGAARCRGCPTCAESLADIAPAEWCQYFSSPGWRTARRFGRLPKIDQQESGMGINKDQIEGRAKEVSGKIPERRD
jgi:hypothetical protein